MPDVVAFLGPSLPAAAVPPGIAVWPPVQRGDVLRALAAGARTLVVVDGVFHVVPAVSHQELVYALDCGVRVLGAASMGALRAAELAAFGMEAVGEIAAWYRSGAIDGDDEVALLHAPAEAGYRPLTVPLVDVRHALGWRPGAAGDAAAASLLRALAALPYRERDGETIEELARLYLGSARAVEMLASLAHASLKREDALAALARAQEPAIAAPPRRRPLNGYLATYLERCLTVPAGEEEVSLEEAWTVARLLHPQMPAWVAAQRRRWLAAMVDSPATAMRPDASAATTARAETLRSRHQRAWGRLLLPPVEYDREAEAELACGYDLDADDDHERHEALVAEGDLLPDWWLCRAFSFTAALPAAAATAAAAREVAACFGGWSAGRRVAPAELRRLAAELWSCAAASVGGEAARRALLAGEGLGVGLDAALERIVVAERLPRPINDYREARARLVASELVAPSSPVAVLAGGHVFNGGV